MCHEKKEKRIGKSMLVAIDQERNEKRKKERMLKSCVMKRKKKRIGKTTLVVIDQEKNEKRKKERKKEC